MVATHKGNGYYSINLLNAVYIGICFKILWGSLTVFPCCLMFCYAFKWCAEHGHINNKKYTRI